MIGNRVREMREALALTQAQLAARLRIRRATLSRLENGKVGCLDLRIFDRLCQILECQPGDLLFRRARARRR